MAEIKIAPSILSADFGQLNAEIKTVEPFVDLIHVDVMDGHFVPNLTIGPCVVKKIQSEKPLDVHLMVENPGNYVEEFAKAGAAIITVHAEACDNLSELIEKIKDFGVKAAISFNPNTPLDAVDEKVFSQVDMVLIMSVEPGFPGQKFNPAVLPKLEKLRALKPDLDLQVDGGITPETIGQAAKAGANVFVAGSAIFGQADRKKAVEELKAAAGQN